MQYLVVRSKKTLKTSRDSDHDEQSQITRLRARLLRQQLVLSWRAERLVANKAANEIQRVFRLAA